MFLGSFMFSVVPLLMFVFIGFFIFKFVTESIRNANSPIITVDAAIVAKRVNVDHSTNTNADGIMSTSSTTHYYITFETEHGERIEFHVSGRIYGLLAEGDTGSLTYQGTWFKDFQRSSVHSN